jgi:hypothetical protein
MILVGDIGEGTRYETMLLVAGKLWWISSDATELPVTESLAGVEGRLKVSAFEVTGRFELEVVSKGDPCFIDRLRRSLLPSPLASCLLSKEDFRNVNNFPTLRAFRRVHHFFLGA